MGNIRSLLEPNGRLFIEVPNIAYWPNRVGLLVGRSPLVSIDQIYESEEPFIGHHHEYTIDELRKLVSLSGLTITREDFYNYSVAGIGALAKRPVAALAFAFLKESRECMAVTCRLQASSAELSKSGN